MEFSFGTLELSRSRPNHLGNGMVKPATYNLSMGGKVDPVSGVSREIAGVAVTPASGEHRDFSSYLMEAVNKVNDLQMNEINIQKQVVMNPESVDVHDVTVAMAQAKMSLDLAQTVIDRLVSGWTELSQNR